MITKISLIFALIFLVSCGNLGVSRQMKLRPIESQFASSGVLQYFIPSLPLWANRPINGMCARKSSPRLLDFDKMRKSFSMSYAEIINFQHTYSLLLEEEKKIMHSEFLLTQDEERIFYNTLDRVNSKLQSFMPPVYKKVYLVWIDPWTSKGEIKQLRAILSSAQFVDAPTVLVSLCLSAKELEEVGVSLSLSHQIKFLPMEFLSPFSANFELHHQLEFHFKELFGPKQDLIFVLPKGVPLPVELKGEIVEKRV